MSAVKRNANGKSTKSSKKPKEVDVSSRVGPNYQVDVPEFVYNQSSSFLNECSAREVNVWNPEHSPPLPDMDTYLSQAKKYRYSEESARILLHYHKYNIQHAVDDLPNYQPILNTYNKLEVRRFLKCVDSRPRKNFVNVRESFPAYRMGELHALYYAIAAPFKAIPRHNRKHGRQMQTCYERAVKRGFTSSTAVSVPVVPSVVDPEEAEADSSFERYLCEMLGQERANKVVAGVRRGRSTTEPSTNSNTAVPMRLAYGGTANGALPFGRRYIAATESLVGSSDHSSALESHSKAAKRSVPAGLDFDYDKFKEFMTTPLEDLKQKQKESKATLSSLDTELKVRTELVESQNKHIFEGLDAFFPKKGFLPISYRWTKSELALLVMALNEYGKDFINIARILGTKSESLVRDFYNKYNDTYDLDGFIGKENGKSEEITKTPSENPEGEIVRPLEPESVAGDPGPLDLAALATEVKSDPEIKTPLVNGELESASKGSTSELESPFIVTAPLKHSPRGSSHMETPPAPDESSSSQIPHVRAPKEMLEQEGNKFPQNTVCNKPEAEKIKEEEEEQNRQIPRGQKRPAREAAAKTATPSRSTESPAIARRRRSRRSSEDAQAAPSRRTRTSNALATPSPVRSGVQTRRSSVVKAKVDRRMRSRKQNQGVKASSEKVIVKRGKRLQSAGRGEKEVGERKRKKVETEAEQPTVSTRRRALGPSQAPVTIGSPRKRTRASLATSPRPSTRQRR
ncbi:REST corepressor 1 [Echinococcus granulosus]|uniref:REST corepressor 3 n=1 Tax=Echinococcus granulosus TaxID=6210 RepID=A0A068WIV1_ECHGR|nr:REST corepressor 1 [Echinococcus granulosus]CDS18362.1 REST corepressor 3 [Echinococcus granulosus]